MVPKISRKSGSQEKFQGQIFPNLVGGPSLPGGRKISKKLRWVDRDCRAVYKTEKIVDLWHADRQIIDVKILPN